MIFKSLFRRREDPLEGIALALYQALVGKARDPLFYTDLAVPDTVNGRFDMVVVHAMLVLRRLRGAGAPGDAVGKAMLELLFRDMDQSLREMGVGDMGMKHHIKRMAKALFGRAGAYEAGLDGDDAALTTAVKENIYRHNTGEVGHYVARLGDYLQRATRHLAAQSVEEILAGRVDLSVPVLVSEPAHVG